MDIGKNRVAGHSEIKSRALKRNKIASHSKIKKRATKKNEVARHFKRKEEIKVINGEIFEVSFFD